MIIKSKLFIVALVALSFCGCTDFLTREPLAKNRLSEYFISDTAATSAVNAAYVPAQWQLGDTYFNEWFIGDVVSDDALKGGASVGDMQSVLLMENFQTTANNELLLPFYKANYQGLFRCNFAIENITSMPPEYMKNTELKKRLLAESHFLRAYYFFRLARVFGGVLKADRTFDQNDLIMPRASKTEIMGLIKSDLEYAIQGLWKKSEYPLTDLGRATKGAAQAMLMRVILFDINNSTDKDADYRQVMALGDSIIVSGEYGLYPDYKSIFATNPDPTLTGRLIEENGIESIFEIQYMEEATSDYGGLGFTRGNFNPIMTRTRGGSEGWGFNRPTQNLYDEYEPGDPRRDETILPYDAADIYGANEGYNNGFHNRKTALAIQKKNGGFFYPPLAHATRSSLNTMVMRYADVLLMYAEAACELNNLPAAKDKLNDVRDRARKSSLTPDDMTVLPPFPYGSYGMNQTDLRAAIRHERRVELAMEGHRWFDLLRWGIAGKVMNAYREKYKDAEGKDMDPFREGVHELFPIPERELNANHALTQNPGY